MSIQALIKKLRRAADVLEELLEVQGTLEIAGKIRRRTKSSGKKRWTTAQRRKFIATMKTRRLKAAA
jgi:hypothetical protein